MTQDAHQDASDAETATDGRPERIAEPTTDLGGRSDGEAEPAVDARRREDEVARLIVSVGVAGGIACCSVAAAANTGRYAIAFVASAICFLAGSGAGLLAVITPASIDGGRVASVPRRKINAIGVGGLFVAMISLVFTSALVAFL